MAKRKVKLLTSISGAGWTASPGDEIELDSAEAARFLAAGMAAEPEDPEPVKERAAVKRSRKGTRR